MLAADLHSHLKIRKVLCDLDNRSCISFYIFCRSVTAQDLTHWLDAVLAGSYFWFLQPDSWSASYVCVVALVVEGKDSMLLTKQFTI
jgi:hypothetical protein